MKESGEKRTTCFICGQEKLFPFLNLGNLPPADSWLRTEDLARPEERYPLELYWCQVCSLAQLNYIVDPEKLFRGFIYATGANNSLVENFRSLARDLAARLALKPGDLAVDIGSNDGTLLANFGQYGVNVLGVDPAEKVAEMARARGVSTLTDFFSDALAEKIRRDYGRAKVIIAANVFAHVDKLDDFMAGVVKLLSPDGIFVSESHYLLDLINKLEYDSIYHEHLRYYALRPLIYLLPKFGLEVIDVERIPTHGGSIRVYAAPRGVYPAANRVGEILAVEEKGGLGQFDTYLNFAEKVKTNRIILRKLIADIKQAGQRIVGIGAPAKGNTLLNYCGLSAEQIDYLVEKNPLKIGRFAPGSHIPVVAEERLYQDQPEYALLLSWNIAEELAVKLRNQGFKGQFIMPVPKSAVI